MEYINRVLYQDVLIVIIEAFYSVAILAISNSAAFAGLYLVAICPSVSSIANGLHRIVVSGKLKVVNPEESQFLLFAYHILCASHIVRLGKFDGNIKAALFKRLNDNAKRNCLLFLFA